MASNAAQIDAVAVPLDADRLEVYRVAREFDFFAARLLPASRVRGAAGSARARQFVYRAEHRGGMRTLRSA